MDISKLGVDNIVSRSVSHITINKYVRKGTGKESDFNKLCYLTIPYTSGDTVKVFNGLSGADYNVYNFFNENTFISDSNTLNSIPSGTTKILVNGNMNNLPYAIINEEPYGIYANYKNIKGDVANIKGYISGKYIDKNGKEKDYDGLCYTVFNYTDGDNLNIKNGGSGAEYNIYNFFNNDVFISSSNSLGNIPSNCNVIKVNASLENPPVVIINGKRNENIVSLSDGLNDLSDGLYTSLTSLITDYGNENLFVTGSKISLSVDENSVYHISVTNNTISFC